METKDKKIKNLGVLGEKEFEVQTDESIARNEIPSKEEGWKNDGFHPSMKFLTSELLAKVTCSIIPAKAGIQNCLNPAPSGTGFRVALRLPGMTIFSCFQEFCKRLKLSKY